MSTLYTNKIIQTPVVVGMPVAQAVRLLSDHNLNIRILAEKEDADLPAGTIISQNPTGGSSIKPQQSIFLVVSTTPQPTIIPRFIGCSAQDIEKIAHERNFKYKLHSLESNYPSNTCFAQWPAPGTVIDKEPLVVYIAAPNRKPIIMPSFIGRPVPEVADFLTSHEMVPQLIHQPAVPDGHICSSACRITDQRPMAGSLVARNSTAPLHIHLQVEER
ncbi:MAG: PASTA domain-containing protein [Candidatus Babeliales bacterium]